MVTLPCLKALVRGMSTTATKRSLASTCLPSPPQTVENVPEEKCELVPHESCNEVARLVPRLKPTQQCVDVPRESCVRVRVNPRIVKRPVVKTWCTHEAMAPK